jgi:ribosome-binding factor A
VPRHHRADRLNETFRRELMHLIQRRLKDPRVQGVTVTEVRASPDLSHATVFLRSETPVEVEDAIEGLESASGYLRRALGQALHIRKVPEFHFIADQTLERAERIEELLRLVREDGPEESGED